MLLNFFDKVIFEFLVNQRNKGITNYRTGKKATPQTRPRGAGVPAGMGAAPEAESSAFPDSARVIGSEGSLQLPATKPTPRVITNSLINLSVFSFCVAGLQILAFHWEAANGMNHSKAALPCTARQATAVVSGHSLLADVFHLHPYRARASSSVLGRPLKASPTQCNGLWGLCPGES